MRSELLLSAILCTLLVAPAATQAQQQVKITNPSALDNPTPVRKSHGSAAGLTAAGISDEQQELVLSYGDSDHWPDGIKNDSARAANKAYIQNFACYRLATYPEDGVAKAIIMIPAKENMHMPEAMRPLADLYVLLPEKAIIEVNTGHQRPEISRGPKWKNLPQAKILKPEDLYATYDLGSDSIALAALRQRGMSPAEIDAVIFRSTDQNWPDGIDTFEERQQLLAKFTKYKAFVGARWSDKILLVVPVEKNKKVPLLMRPYVDLYFVYNAASVQVKEKKRR